MARTWGVAVYLFDVDDPPHVGVTEAHAVLSMSSGATLHGYGRVRRDPSHGGRGAEASDRIAAAGALRDLAHRLLRACSEELSEIEQEDVEILR
ncbi:dsRBD fold-containing protein [Cellulomonas terrae]|uniref:DUF1876 domain-containing protein n=1 Tax=Cellulomonas terrae TaxID=311234 RepID=A0A511JH25_9CELL|nr:dsRBD fold-containing protein [Cellulomonas terrae]GEL97298.1 hypothetical protein CTE05_08450 [Cellulomonas terrae]